MSAGEGIQERGANSAWNYQSSAGPGCGRTSRCLPGWGVGKEEVFQEEGTADKHKKGVSVSHTD